MIFNITVNRLLLVVVFFQLLTFIHTLSGIDLCSSGDCLQPCNNTNGDSNCSCSNGFEQKNESYCQDINECATNTSNKCHQLCNNTIGGYNCSCRDGYTLINATHCDDVDECATNNSNKCHQLCNNTIGGYNCSCRDGYRLTNGTHCDDVDECSKFSTNNCQQLCNNTVGGYICSCDVGFYLDGNFCEDVNECHLIEHNCGKNSTCYNLIGSFHCSCNSGYTGDGKICHEVDECRLNLHNCGRNSTCSNSAGTFKCSCDSGYTGDGVQCFDIDECADGTHKCHRDATCTNTAGSYTCKCNGNKIGNGIICGEPAAFKDSPLSVRVRSGEKVTLSCSYYNSTKTVQFQWIKDYSSIAIGGYKLGTVSKNDRGGVDITTQTMEFNITDVSKQGYYWCKIKEGSFVDTISGKAVVRLTDASSTRLSMKIERTYSVALNQTTSAEHKDLQKKIRTQVKNYMGTMLPKPARTRRSTHAGDPVVLLKNIQRDGTSNILLDAIVYYEKVTATKRLQICSAMQNTTANTLSSSTLKVIDVTRETYDCCYTSWSGDPDIKGVIMWPTQVISETSVVTCPTTRSNENATRACVSNDFDQEPSWQLPNTDKCLFTREATQKLDTLTKTVVNASNAVKVVKELEQVTNNQTNIKTYVDVALAVDVVANVAETQSNNTEAFDGIVNVTNSLMAADTSVVGAAQQKNNASEKLIKAIEKFADNIPLSRNETTKVFSKKNLAIGIADVSKDEKSLEENGFFISGSIGEKETNIDMKKFDGKTEAAKVADIVLPGPLFKKAKNQPGAIKTGLRVTTFLYDNQKLFLSKETSGKNASKKINSKILAVAIKGVKLENLTETQRVRSEFREQLNETEDKSLMCVFWDVSTREWSTRGCRYDGPNPKTPRNHKCSCNHMTNFALLLDVTQKPEGAKSSASAKEFLQFFTLIGCGISLAGLFITLGTIVFFKNLRKKDPQRILLGICCSLILTLIAFLIGTQFTLRFTENQKMLVPNSPTACLVSSVLTHFFVLCAFFWMAMQAYYLYLSCVKVVGVHTTHIMKKMTFTALGLPLVIVAVVIGTDYKNIIEYTKQVKLSVNDTDKILNRGNSYVNIVDESNQICMINGIQFYAAYLGPIGFILLINAVFLTLSLHGIFTSAKKTKSKGMKWQRKWRMVTACTVLLGLTWLIGVFAIGPLKLTLQILFTVFNSLQGLFIFIFYCLLNPKVRQEWRKCLFGDTTEFSSSTRSTKKSTSSFLSSSKSRSSKKPTSKKSKKADENENKNEDEERSRTFTDSLSALQREFAKEDYQEKSVFLKLRDRKGFYSIVNEDTRETQTATFTIKRDPNLSTSL